MGKDTNREGSAVAREKVERFRVIFNDIRGAEYCYYVCTLFGAYKAVLIAADVHHRLRPHDKRVYSVLEVFMIEGNKPEADDLVDRSEW